MSIPGRNLTGLLLALVPLAAFAGQGQMYWTDSLHDKIQTANLDGSFVQDVLLIARPSRIELDVAAQKMYWVSDYFPEVEHRIHRAGLDGSGLETIHELTTDVSGLALDVPGGKLYFSLYDCPGNSRILRSDLDGANVEEIVGGRDRIGAIALDVADDRLIWSGGDDCSQDDPDFFPSRIFRATLDGGGIQSFTAGGVGGELALDTANDDVYWATASDCVPCSDYFRANYDGSGLETLITSWQPTSGFDLDVGGGKMYMGSFPSIWRADLDGSNVTELIDALGAVSGLALHPTSEGIPASSRESVLIAILIQLAAATVLFRYGRRRWRHGDR